MDADGPPTSPTRCGAGLAWRTGWSAAVMRDSRWQDSQCLGNSAQIPTGRYSVRVVKKTTQWGPASWEPPRGARPVGGEPWPSLAQRRLVETYNAEAFAITSHRKVLAELDHARRVRRLSQRAWAEHAELRPNTVGDILAGSVWPSFASLHAMADPLGLTLRLTVRDPLPVAQARWFPITHAARMKVRDRAHAAFSQGPEERTRMAHDLICWQLSYAWKARGMRIDDLRRKAYISPNTITRVRRAPENGEDISYPVMLALACITRLDLVVQSRSEELRLVWMFAAG